MLRLRQNELPRLRVGGRRRITPDPVVRFETVVFKFNGLHHAFLVAAAAGSQDESGNNPKFPGELFPNLKG